MHDVMVSWHNTALTRWWRRSIAVEEFSQVEGFALLGSLCAHVGGNGVPVAEAVQSNAIQQ